MIDNWIKYLIISQNFLFRNVEDDEEQKADQAIAIDMDKNEKKEYVDMSGCNKYENMSGCKKGKYMDMSGCKVYEGLDKETLLSPDERTRKNIYLQLPK